MPISPLLFTNILEVLTNIVSEEKEGRIGKEEIITIFVLSMIVYVENAK